MTSSKNTKRALLASVLSVALCCAMLIGSTFAWFTDSVTSTGNKIVAGNLKVDLIHVGGGRAGEEGITEGADVSLKDNPNHKIFDYDKWEPGYTVMETLKVVNNGNLALKFRLDAVADGATAAETGEKLADVIDVWVYEGEGIPTTQSFAEMSEDADWRNAGSLSALMADTDGMAYGVLLPEGAETNGEPVKEVQMTVALHMQESAGNAYQGLTLGNLNFTLRATQYTFEEDGFGDTYDQNAKYTTITLKSQDEYGLVKVDGFLHAVAKNRLGYTNDTDYKIEKDLVFDGYMFVIEDESALKYGAYYLGSAFAYAPAAAYLKDDNPKYDPDVVAARETITFKNCTFIDKTGNAALVWGNEFNNVAVTVENCTFSGFKTAFQFGQNENNSSTFTMKNNKIVGMRGISLSGFVKDGTTIENNQFLLNGGADGYFVNVAQVVNFADAKIAITGNTVNTTNILNIHSSVKDAANLGSWNGITMNSNKYNSDAVKVAGFEGMDSTITEHYEALVK